MVDFDFHRSVPYTIIDGCAASIFVPNWRFFLAVQFNSRTRFLYGTKALDTALLWCHNCNIASVVADFVTIVDRYRIDRPEFFSVRSKILDNYWLLGFAIT